MSQPVFTSLDPLTINGTILDVGHGNWSQNDGSPLVASPEPKWLPYIVIDGQPYGQTPSLPSVRAETVFPGELPWSERCAFDFAARAPWVIDGRTHIATVHIFAAQYFDGWGDHPEDAWEWGHYSAKDGSAAVLTKTITLSTTPQPVQPNIPAVLSSIEAGVSTLSMSSWAKANPGEYLRLTDYLKDPVKRPTLATWVGRSKVYDLDAYHFARGDHV